jgi:hypothetical protein
VKVLVTVRVAEQNGEGLKELRKGSRQGNLPEVLLSGWIVHVVGLSKIILSKFTVINAALKNARNGLLKLERSKSIKRAYAHVVPKGRRVNPIIACLVKLLTQGGFAPYIRTLKQVGLDTMPGINSIKKKLRSEERQISCLPLKNFVELIQTTQLHLAYSLGMDVRFATV